MNSNAIRAACKEKRSELDPHAIEELSNRITANLWRLPALSRCHRIACYLPFGGEVDCKLAAQIARFRHRKVFLPVIRGRELMFAPYRQDAKFLRNRYGIPEPITLKREIRKPRDMDVVLTPLVAFDGDGNRLGMGAGFYDRSFRFLPLREKWTRPILIGLAYEFQKVPKLKACSWDVPLRYAVTEQQVYAFK